MAVRDRLCRLPEIKIDRVKSRRQPLLLRLSVAVTVDIAFVAVPVAETLIASPEGPGGLLFALRGDDLGPGLPGGLGLGGHGTLQLNGETNVLAGIGRGGKD